MPARPLEIKGLYVSKGKKRNTYYTSIDNVYVNLGHDRDAAIAKLSALDNRINVKPWAKELAKRCRNRAKQKNIACEVDASHIEELFRVQRMRCAVTKEYFREETQPGQRVRWYVPSVDRIDASGPYTKDNVRLVCAYINLAFNQFGEELLRKGLRR